MSLLSDAWIPNLQQSGPPPGASDAELDFSRKSHLVAENLNRLRAIQTHPNNGFAYLLGELEMYDGLLQGLYLAYPRNGAVDNGGSLVVSNDGRTVWRKFQ